MSRRRPSKSPVKEAMLRDIRNGRIKLVAMILSGAGIIGWLVYLCIIKE